MIKGMKNYSTLQRRKTLERQRARHSAIVHGKMVFPGGPKLPLLDCDVIIDALERLITLEIPYEKDKKETN